MLLHAISGRNRHLISVRTLGNLWSWRDNRFSGGSIADLSLGCCSSQDRLCSGQDWCCSGQDRLSSCQDWCYCGDRRLRCSPVFQLTFRGTSCNRLRSNSVPKAKNSRGSCSCDRLCCSAKAESSLWGSSHYRLRSCCAKAELSLWGSSYDRLRSCRPEAELSLRSSSHKRLSSSGSKSESWSCRSRSLHKRSLLYGGSGDWSVGKHSSSFGSNSSGWSRHQRALFCRMGNSEDRSQCKSLLHDVLVYWYLLSNFYLPF